MDLSEAILRYRAAEDISQLEFGRRCGVSRPTIIKAEKGIKMSKLATYKILNLLNKEREVSDE